MIKRLFPESVTGTIKWMEDNFHDIDGFVATFQLKDGKTMTIYDTYSYVQALGLASVSDDAIRQMSYDGNFITKKKPESKKGEILQYANR